MFVLKVMKNNIDNKAAHLSSSSQFISAHINVITNTSIPKYLTLQESPARCVAVWGEGVWIDR